MDDNVTVALNVVRAHQPQIRTTFCCDDHDADVDLVCSATDCNWTSTTVTPSWADHVASAVNDHLGLWGPEDE